MTYVELYDLLEALKVPEEVLCLPVMGMAYTFLLGEVGAEEFMAGVTPLVEDPQAILDGLVGKVLAEGKV